MSDVEDVLRGLGAEEVGLEGVVVETVEATIEGAGRLLLPTLGEMTGGTSDVRGREGP